MPKKKLALKDMPGSSKDGKGGAKGGEIKNSAKETENGVTQYKVQTMLNGKHRDFNLDTQGKLLVVEEETMLEGDGTETKD